MESLVIFREGFHRHPVAWDMEKSAMGSRQEDLGCSERRELDEEEAGGLATVRDKEQRPIADDLERQQQQQQQGPADAERLLLARRFLANIGRVLLWMPKSCRYDPEKPPEFTMGLNMLFSFVRCFYAVIVCSGRTR